MTDVKRHAAYLVRWQEGSGSDQTYWRSTIENAYTGERHDFSDRSELMQFLWRTLFNEVPPAEMKTSQQEDK